MNRRHFLVAGAALGVSACHSIPTTTFTYRLKIVIDDNGLERSGSSIIKVEWSDHSEFPMRYSGAYDTRAWGEAPFVDMGQRGLLFAMLADNSFDTRDRFRAQLTPVVRLFGDERSTSSNPYNLKPDFWTAVKSMRQRTGEHDLWPSQMPQLARFEDISKPESVVEVLPERVPDIYGSGVSLRRATIELTDEPPTERILDVLPWLTTTEFFTTIRSVPRTSTFAERTNRSHFRMWG